MATGDFIAHSDTPEARPMVQEIYGHPYSDKWYRHYICGNSVSVYVEAGYDALGSDRIKVLVHRWDIKSSQWILMREINYLNGDTKQSYILNVNGNAPRKANYLTDDYTGKESVHFCVSTMRIGWGLHRDKGSYIAGYLGNYNSTGTEEYNNYIKGSYIRCKQAKNSYLWHDETDYMPNPFDTEWGKTTINRGSFILPSHKDNLIAY